MSAYGTITRVNSSEGPLASTIWTGRSSASGSSLHVTIHHLRLSFADTPQGLLEHLSKVFAQEVEDGRTYPQEGRYDLDAFVKYFFAEDVFLAIKAQSSDSDTTPLSIEDGAETRVSIDEVRKGRAWEDCVVGYYYVKPNYPGRSSHICNAGFIVPPNQRAGGFGSILAKSFVHYAPRLGYRASVFNLVYVNNIASIKLWERLGFTKVGRIPQAGRLKRKDGQGEEYVDAWVVYKSFVESSDTKQEGETL